MRHRFRKRFVVLSVAIHVAPVLTLPTLLDPQPQPRPTPVAVKLVPLPDGALDSVPAQPAAPMEDAALIQAAAPTEAPAPTDAPAPVEIAETETADPALARVDVDEALPAETTDVPETPDVAEPAPPGVEVAEAVEAGEDPSTSEPETQPPGEYASADDPVEASEADPSESSEASELPVDVAGTEATASVWLEPRQPDGPVAGPDADTPGPQDTEATPTATAGALGEPKVPEPESAPKATTATMGDRTETDPEVATVRAPPSSSPAPDAERPRPRRSARLDRERLIQLIHAKLVRAMPLVYWDDRRRDEVVGAPSVRFRLTPKGYVTGFEQVESSGSDEVDRAAYVLLHVAEPFVYVPGWIELKLKFRG